MSFPAPPAAQAAAERRDPPAGSRNAAQPRQLDCAVVRLPWRRRTPGDRARCQDVSSKVPITIVTEARELAALGVPGVILFGIPDRKDADGYGAADPDGPVPIALKALKRELPDLSLWADVCLCDTPTMVTADRL